MGRIVIIVLILIYNYNNILSYTEETKSNDDIKTVNTDNTNDDMVTEKIPKIKLKFSNGTHKLYELEDDGSTDSENMQNVVKSRNKTHDIYKVKYMTLLPADNGNTVWNKIGKVVGVIPILNRGLGTKCWKDVGCFSAVIVKDLLNGQIAMLPMSPFHLNVTFHMFTHRSRNQSIVLRYDFNATELQNSTFNPDHITVIIVHGFQSGLADWMIAIKDEIYSQIYNTFNIILVDWHNGAQQYSYALAASNTRVVGSLIAIFMDSICQLHKSLSADNFYLIGHSLGAHVMGFAGKRFDKPKVSRITGLDPAGPGFDIGNYFGLHNTDASLVDIIHTDTAESLLEGLGLSKSIGDIDFYPNGGRYQPGCPQTRIINNMLKSEEQMSCSHTRAEKLVYSMGNIKSHCLPVGYTCSDWSTFVEGRCANCNATEGGDRCLLMGLFPRYWKEISLRRKFGIGTKFYLNTASDRDFCIYHYQIALHMSADSDAGSRGEFTLTLKGQVGNETKNLTIKRIMSDIEPGQVHTLLVTFKFMVKRITSGVFKWSNFQNMLAIGEKIKINFIEMNFMSHLNDKIRKEFSSLLCPINDVFIRPQLSRKNFVKCQDNNVPPRYANTMYSNVLKAFTKSKDIESVDFDGKDIIKYKLSLKKPIKSRTRSSG